MPGKKAWRVPGGRTQASFLKTKHHSRGSEDGTARVREGGTAREGGGEGGKARQLNTASRPKSTRTNLAAVRTQALWRGQHPGDWQRQRLPPEELHVRDRVHRREVTPALHEECGGLGSVWGGGHEAPVLERVEWGETNHEAPGGLGLMPCSGGLGGVAGGGGGGGKPDRRRWRDLCLCPGFGLNAAMQAQPFTMKKKRTQRRPPIGQRSQQRVQQHNQLNEGTRDTCYEAYP